MSSRLTPRTEFYARPYTFSYRKGAYGYTLDDLGNPAFLAIDSHHINVSGDRVTPNPFGFTKYTYSPKSGYKQYTADTADYAPATSTYEGTGVCEMQSHDCADDNLVARATVSCLSKVINEIKASDLNLATSVGEGRETITLLNNISVSGARSFAHIFRAAASRDWRRQVKLAGGVVLLTNLALKPLLGDIAALRKHVLATPQLRQKRTVEHRSGKTEMYASNRSTQDSGYTYIHDEKLTSSARCRISLDVEVNDLHQFESWRAGLLVRPSLAWELTTLSFLVDYFYDIGRMIEQYEASVMSNGFSVSNVVTTITTKSTWDVSYGTLRTTSDLYYGSALTSEQGAYTFETKSLERTVASSLPSVPPPLIKVPRSATQLLNIAGLLTNLFKLSNRG